MRRWFGVKRTHVAGKLQRKKPFDDLICPVNTNNISVDKVNCRFGINKHIYGALYECLFTFELVVQLHNPSSALLEEDHWAGSEELETKITLGLKSTINLTWYSGKGTYLSSFSLQLEHNISQVLEEWSFRQLTKIRGGGDANHTASLYDVPLCIADTLR